MVASRAARHRDIRAASAMREMGPSAPAPPPPRARPGARTDVRARARLGM